MAKLGGHYILPPVYFFFFFFLISIKDLVCIWTYNLRLSPVDAYNDSYIKWNLHVFLYFKFSDSTYHAYLLN